VTVSEDEPAVRLLVRAVAAMVDEMHRRLADLGHPDLRTTHGFLLNALGPDGATTAELGQALGMTKQGAAKVVGQLADLGYVTTVPDPEDGRARPVVLTHRGREALAAAAGVQRKLEGELARVCGRADVDTTRRVLTAAVRRWSADGSASLRPLR
jgi:DNA-binding MarR family transcriptional regulator